LILSFSQQLLVLILALLYDLLLLIFIKQSALLLLFFIKQVCITSTAMRSVWRFMDEKNAAHGIRLSIEPSGNQQNIDAVLLYAVEQRCGA
jgi:hypothetical protein